MRTLSPAGSVNLIKLTPDFILLGSGTLSAITCIEPAHLRGREEPRAPCIKSGRAYLPCRAIVTDYAVVRAARELYLTLAWLTSPRDNSVRHVNFLVYLSAFLALLWLLQEVLSVIFNLPNLPQLRVLYAVN